MNQDQFSRAVQDMGLPKRFVDLLAACDESSLQEIANELERFRLLSAMWGITNGIHCVENGLVGSMEEYKRCLSEARREVGQPQ